MFSGWEIYRVMCMYCHGNTAKEYFLLSDRFRNQAFQLRFYYKNAPMFVLTYNPNTEKKCYLNANKTRHMLRSKHHNAITKQIPECPYTKKSI